MKETIAGINKTKSLFFEKINKIDKPLARLIREEKRRGREWSGEDRGGGECRGGREEERLNLARAYLVKV